MFPMRVIPFEAGRFHVNSESEKGKVYLVDVMEHNGRGACDCDNYRIRLESKNLRTDCKHLFAVWKWLGMQVAKEMVEQHKLNEQPE